MATGKRGATAPRARSGPNVDESERHTVRVRVPRKLVEPLAKRWGVEPSEAVLRAVREAFDRL